MFEIFFFINPIGIYCYDIEKRILKTTTDLNIDVSCHFIPVTNPEIIQEDIIRRRQECQTLTSCSRYTIAVNYALTDYHALKLAYGNKKARRFLLNLQQKLNQDENVFSSCLSKSILKEINIDIKTIQSLRNSKYIRDSIEQDQKLIKQWHIKQTPTVIVFNENNEEDNGVMLEGIVDQNELRKLFLPDQQPQNPKLNHLFSSSYLRLI